MVFMRICVLRHGIADDPTRDRPDEERALTEAGRRSLTRILSHLASVDLRPDLILSSPYLRAMQTAEIAADCLGYKDDIVTARALEPEADPQAAWDEVRAWRPRSCVLLVSHNPLCSLLARFLLQSPALSVDFGKAALFCAQVRSAGPQPRCTLEWFLRPSVLLSAAFRQT